MDDSRGTAVATPGEAQKGSLPQVKPLQISITQGLLPRLCIPWHYVQPSLMAELLYLEMPGAFPSYLSQETSWNPVIIVLWDFPTTEGFSDPFLVHKSQIWGIETERICLTFTFLRENKALSWDSFYPRFIYRKVI